MTYREVKEEALKLYPFGKILENGKEVVDDSTLKEKFDAYMQGYLTCARRFEAYKRQLEPLLMMKELAEKHPELASYIAKVGERLEEAVNKTI